MDDVVAVEHVDDNAVYRDDRLVLTEQDKNTARRGVPILGDRSHALWRTLQIWLRLRETPDGADCGTHLLFVNRWVSSPIALMIRNRRRDGIATTRIVAALRLVGSRSRGRLIDDVVADVLSRSDQQLTSLIDAVEIVVEADASSRQSAIVNGFAIHPDIDPAFVLDGLLGWLTAKLRQDWTEGRPAMVRRSEAVRQSAHLQENHRRSRFLPTASARIAVSQRDRDAALARNFVGHLTRIAAERDVVVEAVGDFVRFNMEKKRLVEIGDVPMCEWQDRSDRLKRRWSGSMRRRMREMHGSSAEDIGKAVLSDATEDHRERLWGHSCDEQYMTSGHYHRLADANDVWWHPDFEAETPDEG